MKIEKKCFESLNDNPAELAEARGFSVIIKFYYILELCPGVLYDKGAMNISYRRREGLLCFSC